MGIAMLFPGQGAQSVGMVQDLYRTFPTVRDVFAQASELSGINLAELCFKGPRSVLNATEYTQPAIFTASLAVYHVLHEAGIQPRWMAGHSLGELTALTAAGAIDLAQGLELVCARGKLMNEDFSKQHGIMAAVDGPTAAEIIGWIDSQGTGVWIANYNAPNQTVVSGTPEALELLTATARAAGAKVTRLNVSGAFHTPLLATAALRFSELVNTVKLCNPLYQVISNIHATPLTSEGEVRAELSNQMCAPVRWTDSMAWLQANGVSHYIEVGPGKILKGLLLRNIRAAQCLSTETAKDVDMLLRTLEITCQKQ